MSEEPWCPIVQEWMKQGQIDLNELRKHVVACKICQAIYQEVLDALKEALWEGDEEDEEG